MAISDVPGEILRDVETALHCSVSQFSPTGGGCINHGGRLQTSKGPFFIKWNRTEALPQMFKTESKGLKLLRDTKTIHVPEVVLESVAGNLQYLVLEYIESKLQNARYWTDFGRNLALLHKNSNESFGLDHDNYVGSLKQYNHQETSWGEFLISQRLDIMVKLAGERGHIDSRAREKFDALYKRLNSILSDEKPSLLHGDLWAGNLIVDDLGSPCMIDPAVYYGNREVDLAMTQLFGGFDKAFFESYNEEFPLAEGYESRIRIYQLYPLLVHVNLFGKSYLPKVVSILNEFV
jgi:protein-ribulosamine 3-kinase